MVFIYAYYPAKGLRHHPQDHLQASLGLVQGSYLRCLGYVTTCVLKTMRSFSCVILSTMCINVQELREYREKIPCIVVANKIDGKQYSFTLHAEYILCDCWIGPFNCSVHECSEVNVCHWALTSLCLVCPTVDLSVTHKSFSFGKKHGMPFYFVSAADGTNVVKVRQTCTRPGTPCLFVSRV